MPNSPIQLVSAADSKFVPGLITALGSALASASGAFNYHISIVDGGLTDGDWSEIVSCFSRSSVCKGVRVSATRIPAADVMHSDMPSRRGSQLTYSRLFIPGFFKVQKLVYIDSDVLCLRGIEDFWKNLDNHTLVATRDPLGTIRRDSFARHRLPFTKHGLPYFNAGIIGINCERWALARNQHRIKALLPLAEQFRYADQSLLNCAFFDDWREIPAINNQVLSLGNCASLRTVETATNLHFVGTKKPWLSSSSVAYRHPSNLLFDKTYEWISGIKLPARQLDKESLRKLQQKISLYRLLRRSRCKQYADAMESALHPEEVIGRLWESWIDRCSSGVG